MEPYSVEAMFLHYWTGHLDCARLVVSMLHMLRTWLLVQSNHGTHKRCLLHFLQQQRVPSSTLYTIVSWVARSETGVPAGVQGQGPGVQEVGLVATEEGLGATEEGWGGTE